MADRVIPIQVALAIKALDKTLTDLKASVDERVPLELVKLAVDQARKATEGLDRLVPTAKILEGNNGLPRHLAFATWTMNSGAYPDQDVQDLVGHDFEGVKAAISTTADVPERAADFNRALAELEGLRVDFKRDIPAQVRNLAEVFASFALLGGSVYLGVNNAGQAIGLPLSMVEDVDRYELRLRGIADGVEPPIKLRVHWFGVGDAVIAEAEVEPSEEPIHYVENRPYLRDGSRSRPAQPAEVIRLIRDHDR